MRKMLIKLFIPLIFLAGCSVQSNEKNASYNNERRENKSENINYSDETYTQSVSHFTRLNPAKFSDIIEKDNKPVYIYFGRETCQYCRAFVPKLRSAAVRAKVHIYYLDTENYKTDKDIQSVRNSYQIDSVPSLIKVKANGKLVEKFQESDNTEDIPKDLLSFF